MFKKAIEQLRRAKVQDRFPDNDNDWITRMWGGTIKYTKGKTAPRVEKNIVEFLQLSGHQAEKRAVMGRQITAPDIKTSIGTIRGKSSYIPYTGTKGYADISSVIFGLAVLIEVKVGKDRQSKEQKKYESAIKKAGGFYFIAHDEDDFLIKYKELIKHPTMILMKDFNKTLT